eukprot:176266-Pyramimonas_sp.AAC.1
MYTQDQIDSLTTTRGPGLSRLSLDECIVEAIGGAGGYIGSRGNTTPEALRIRATSRTTLPSGRPSIYVSGPRFI